MILLVFLKSNSYLFKLGNFDRLCPKSPKIWLWGSTSVEQLTYAPWVGTDSTKMMMPGCNFHVGFDQCKTAMWHFIYTFFEEWIFLKSRRRKALYCDMRMIWSQLGFPSEDQGVWMRAGCVVRVGGCLALRQIQVDHISIV